MESLSQRHDVRKRKPRTTRKQPCFLSILDSRGYLRGSRRCAKCIPILAVHSTVNTPAIHCGVPSVTEGVPGRTCAHRDIGKWKNDSGVACRGGFSPGRGHLSPPSGGGIL